MGSLRQHGFDSDWGDFYFWGWACDFVSSSVARIFFPTLTLNKVFFFYVKTIIVLSSNYHRNNTDIHNNKITITSPGIFDTRVIRQPRYSFC